MSEDVIRTDDLVEGDAHVDRGAADPSAVRADADDADAPIESSESHDSTQPTKRLRRRDRDRVSKWDRPPEPRDWRYFVGTLGKILISAGLLLFGFVGYQLWGTGIETARAQSRLDGEFAALLIKTATIEPETVTERPPPPRFEIEDVEDIPVQVEPALVEEPIVPVEQALPTIFEGDGIARLQIPRIDLDWVVVAGVSPDDLQNGPGHFPDTPLPGQLGNSAIAGHRTTWGEPFRNVDQLEPGDRIVATTPAGQFVYEVTGTQIVGPSDYHVVATTNPNIAQLTLTSCHPVFSASKRIVISALLRPDLSDGVGLPTSYEADADTAAPGLSESGLPGEVVAEVPATAPPVEADLGGTLTTAEAPAVDVDDDPADAVLEAPEAAVATVPDIGPADAGVDTAAPDAAEEAFARGWFHDSTANPQVALWGTVLIALSVGGSFISRRFRSDLIGLGIAVIPFTVSLYFFFQNVNRLLPPNL